MYTALTAIRLLIPLGMPLNWPVDSQTLKDLNGKEFSQPIGDHRAASGRKHADFPSMAVERFLRE